jgi:beta-glucosidase-like glycosyl hydrolase
MEEYVSSSYSYSLHLLMTSTSFLGRGMLSEDPFLANEIAYSVVTGLQSENVSATVKHFLSYSAPEQGLNTGPVHGGERELRTTYAIDDSLRK